MFSCVLILYSLYGIEEGQPMGIGSANQPQLQSADLFKIGVSSEHHGAGSKLHAAGRLQGIRCAQPMACSQLGRQLHHRGRELNPHQIGLREKDIEAIQAGLIASP